MRLSRRRWLAALLAILLAPTGLGATPPPKEAGEVRIVLWNVRNFGVSDHFVAGKRREDIMKPAAEIQSMVAILQALDPDILAVNEVISAPDDRYVRALSALLKRAGLDYPHLATVRGSDDRIQNVLLSRLPLRDIRQLDEDSFTLRRRSASTGQTLPVELRPLRGFLYATAELPDGGELGLVVAHLKSKAREPDIEGPDPDVPGDEAIRLEETQLLAQAIRRLQADHPDRPLVLLGDLNDTPNSASVRLLAQSVAAPEAERAALVDLQLTDYHGDRWTHFYFPAKAYNVLDYIWVSPSLRDRLRPDACFVYRAAETAGPRLVSATASDHRPLVITLKPHAAAGQASSASSP
ncbi:MAG: endonuclease/exonuclease/phosphatase family protein [Verrucomicrobiota bacterium]